MGRVVCVSQFRLDRDKFDQRLGRLEKDGEAFDKAQNEFALGAQAATGAMASAPAPGGQNSAGIGDRVRVMETRPLSAQKRWRLVEIIERAK